MSTLTEQELRGAIQAKSDQINAVDLAGGPLVCQITGVTRGSADQPVVISVDAHPQPWKPSKTSLRVLCACWGADPSVWVGRHAVLYNDEAVKWGGVAVGGIRTSHLSHITERKVVMVNETRGKKGAQIVEPYYPDASNAPAAAPEYYPEEKFEENLSKWVALIDSGDKTVAQIVKAVERGGKLTVGQRARIKKTDLPPEPEEPAMDEPPPREDGDDPFA